MQVPSGLPFCRVICAWLGCPCGVASSTRLVLNQEIVGANPTTDTMPKRRWGRIWHLHKKEFSALVKSSSTLAELIRKLGFPVGMAAYRAVKERIAEEHVDASHIPSGLDSNKGRPCQWIPAFPLAKVLVAGSTYNRTNLKRRLIKEGLLVNRCAACDTKPIWRGKPLVLILDHINGIRDDNRLQNLRLVCPNCASQLPTFGRRNKAYKLSS